MHVLNKLMDLGHFICREGYDSNSNFVDWLIFQGEEFYHKALADPEECKYIRKEISRDEYPGYYFMADIGPEAIFYREHHPELNPELEDDNGYFMELIGHPRRDLDKAIVDDIEANIIYDKYIDTSGAFPYY